jgi:glycosyltransferase involved in cell wall biosynthesis
MLTLQQVFLQFLLSFVPEIGPIFYLTACIRYLKYITPVYEIIIVDNAPSNDDTKTLVAELPVRYIREKRLGLNWARNRGLQEARYPIVAFTDDDAKVDEHWLYAINNAFRDENVKAVSGMVGPAELNTKRNGCLNWATAVWDMGSTKSILTGY